MNVPGTKPIRLLLVDRQQALRRGLKMRFALEPDLEVVGEAGDATEAISLAHALRPDVVLMDLSKPDVSGIDRSIKTLRTIASQSGVVIFTLRDDTATRAQAQEAGAAAFVAKHQAEEELLAAIRRVASERHGRSDT